MNAPLPMTQPAPAHLLAGHVKNWIKQHVLPVEARLLQDEGEAKAEELLAQLRQSAQENGVFGLFYPEQYGGQLSSLAAYLSIAEQESYSEFGSIACGSEATLDVHMLHKYGNPSLRSRYLPALASGAAVAAYAMTEPDRPGSCPEKIQAQARLVDGVWHLQAHKWFICRAERADFFTVLAHTSDNGEQGLSMLLVPRDSPGCKVLRNLPVLGRKMGQAEILFENVQVAQDYVLGPIHGAAAILQSRLGLGRILRSTQWLGLAQRCFDLMCQRICAPRSQHLQLMDKQLIRQQVYLCHQAIINARAQLNQAATLWDTHNSTTAATQNSQQQSICINGAKLAASHALCLCADAAIQVYGAEGLSDLTPLGAIYRMARATRMMDGGDEALISAIGRQLLQAYVCPTA